MGIEEFLLDREKKEGRKEGLEKGRRELEKAKEELENTIRQTALKMIQNGIEIHMVANITGLSIEEIQKLY